MLKIAFYYPRFGKPVDFSHIEDGNPGIGGTECCFALLMSTLAKYFKDRLKLVFFSHEEFQHSDLFECRHIKSTHDLYAICSEERFDFIVLRTLTTPEDFEELDYLSPHVKIIFWSHNYFNSHVAKLIVQEKRIVGNVFVSKQVYDFYYDDDVINKSTYIFNPVADNQVVTERTYQPYTAVYMGAIEEDKGIVELLKVWQNVLKKYPNAILKIIGKCYGAFGGRNAVLGNLGIASPELEEKLKPYLCDENGRLKSNYQLLGLLGTEKYDVFQQSAVGIVNPSAKTETFGLGIIEMATVELPVVTRSWNAHLDTIKNEETGLMALSLHGMANCIIRLFEDEELNLRLGRNAKNRVKEFSPCLIAKDWMKVFETLARNEKLEKLTISAPWWNNYKILRQINGWLRFGLGLKVLPSIVSVETLINDLLKKMR